MLRRLLILIAVSLIVTFSATADIVPFLDTVVDLGGGDFGFNYAINVSGVERLDPTATNGLTCGGAACNPAGTFFTIYDIPDFVGTGAVLPSGWGVSVQLTGLTPFNAGVPDGSLMENVTFTYTGPVINGPVDISGFQIISTSNAVAPGSYSSQATNNTADLLNGTTDFAFGSVSVPKASAVPEPASTAILLSGGLIGLALVRKRFTRQ
ncbi:MAG: PEP-CTERM sorting domain-containing protein [Acidobacteriia bacterium]|nr:PEP-CTERM sorting domain-containing protein [Terriglobia bacterium]